MEELALARIADARIVDVRMAPVMRRAELVPLLDAAHGGITARSGHQAVLMCIGARDALGRDAMPARQATAVASQSLAVTR